MILVTGASGVVGGPVLRNLLQDGHGLRALTSNEASAQKLRDAGVTEIVVGDFRSDADVARAVAGVDTVVHIPPAVVEDEHAIGYRVIDAAAAAGIGHFVYVSCYHSHPADVPSHHNKLLVEDALYKSELSYTILQPSMFMQNLDIVWADIAARGVMAWAWSDQQKAAMFDTEDLGVAVAKVIADPRFRGGTYELSSDDTLTVAEMAAIVGDVWGKPVRSEVLDLETWLSGLAKVGVPDWTVWNLREMFGFYHNFGYRGGNSVVYQAVTGRKPTSYREFVTRFLRDKQVL